VRARFKVTVLIVDHDMDQSATFGRRFAVGPPTAADLADAVVERHAAVGARSNIPTEYRLIKRAGNRYVARRYFQVADLAVPEIRAAIIAHMFAEPPAETGGSPFLIISPVSVERSS
jgi:hypothetical protein